MDISIVVAGYNRPDSIHQLIDSLLKADYCGDSVDLFISLDKGTKEIELLEYSKKITWTHGEKIIRTFPKRQGLKAHIIQCGDLTEKYDAVIVLEDDLIVAPHFYSYVKQAINKYEGNDRIAGISLYKHQMHPGVKHAFEPSNNGYDVFMMQYAMSWGQCWTKRMWNGFRTWFNENKESDLKVGDAIPEYIASWKRQSWLKYYMQYIVETDKFFVYPYFSLASNSTDAGEHNSIPNNDFQVSLQEGDLEYRMPNIAEAVKYDIFFERMGIEDKIFAEYEGRKILDLYGNRNSLQGAKYVISTRALPYKVVKQFQLKYRPIEVNCLMPKEGIGIYMYDTEIPSKPPKENIDIFTRYDVRSVSWKRILHLGVSSLKDALIRKTFPRRK